MLPIEGRCFSAILLPFIRTNARSWAVGPAPSGGGWVLAFSKVAGNTA